MSERKNGRFKFEFASPLENSAFIQRKRDQDDLDYMEQYNRDWDEYHAEKSISKKENQSGSLTVSSPADPSEQQADKIASQVVNNQPVDKIESIASPAVQSKQEGSSNLEVTPHFENKLNSTKGNGSPLDESTRSEMEVKMGADFSQTKIHTGHTADELTKNVHAKAFTHGQDIYFNNNETPENKELLAHELVHVGQGADTIQTKIFRQDGDGDKGKETKKEEPKYRLPYYATTGPYYPDLRGYEDDKWVFESKGEQTAMRYEPYSWEDPFNPYVNSWVAGETSLYDQEYLSLLENLNVLANEKPADKTEPVKDFYQINYDKLDDPSTLETGILNLFNQGERGWAYLLMAAYSKPASSAKIQAYFSMWMKDPQNGFTNYLFLLSQDQTTVLSDYAINVLTRNNSSGLVDKQSYVQSVHAKMMIALDLFAEIIPNRSELYDNCSYFFNEKVLGVADKLSTYDIQKLSEIGTVASDVITYLGLAKSIKAYLASYHELAGGDPDEVFSDPTLQSTSKLPWLWGTTEKKQPAFSLFSPGEPEKKQEPHFQALSERTSYSLEHLYLAVTDLSYGFVGNAKQYEYAKQGIEKSAEDAKWWVDEGMMTDLMSGCREIVSQISSLREYIGTDISGGSQFLEIMNRLQIRFMAILRVEEPLYDLARRNPDGFYKFWISLMQEMPEARVKVQGMGMAAQLYTAWNTYDDAWLAGFDSFMQYFDINSFIRNASVKTQKALLQNKFTEILDIVKSTSLDAEQKSLKIKSISEDQRVIDMLKVAKKYGDADRIFKIIVTIVVAILVVIASIWTAGQAAALFLGAFGTAGAGGVVTIFGSATVASVLAFGVETVAFTVVERSLTKAIFGEQEGDNSFLEDLLWNTITFGALKGISKVTKIAQEGATTVQKIGGVVVTSTAELGTMVAIEYIHNCVKNLNLPPEKQTEFDLLTSVVQGAVMLVGIKVGMIALAKLPPGNLMDTVNPDLRLELDMKELEFNRQKDILAERDLLPDETSALKQTIKDILRLRIAMAEAAAEGSKLPADKLKYRKLKGALQSRLFEFDQSYSGVFNLRISPTNPRLMFFEGDVKELKNRLLSGDKKASFNTDPLDSNTFIFTNGKGDRFYIVRTRTTELPNVNGELLAREWGVDWELAKTEFAEKTGDPAAKDFPAFENYVVEAMIKGWRPGLGLDVPEIPLEKSRRMIRTERYRVVYEKFGKDTEQLKALKALESLPLERLKNLLPQVRDVGEMNRISRLFEKLGDIEKVAVFDQYIKVIPTAGDPIVRIDVAPLIHNNNINTALAESGKFTTAEFFNATLRSIPDMASRDLLETRMANDVNTPDFERNIENTDSILDGLSATDKIKMIGLIAGTSDAKGIQHYAEVKNRLALEQPDAALIIETAHQQDIKNITDRMINTPDADFSGEQMSESMRQQFGDEYNNTLLEQAYEGLHKMQLGGVKPEAGQDIFIGSKFYFDPLLNPVFFGKETPNGQNADLMSRAEDLNAQNPEGLSFTADGHLDIEPLALRHSQGIVSSDGTGDPVVVDFSNASELGDLGLNKRISGMSGEKKDAWGKTGAQRTYKKDAAHANLIMRKRSRTNDWGKKWKQPEGTFWWNKPGTEKLFLIRETDLKILNYETGVHDKGAINVSAVEAKAPELRLEGGKRMFGSDEKNLDFRKGASANEITISNRTVIAKDHPGFESLKTQIISDVNALAEIAAKTEFAPGKTYQVRLKQSPITETADRAQFVVREIIDQTTGERFIEFEVFMPLEGEFHVAKHEGRHIQTDLRMVRDANLPFQGIINEVLFITPNGEIVDIGDARFDNDTAINQMAAERFNTFADAIVEYHNRLVDYVETKKSIEERRKKQPLKNGEADPDAEILARLAAEVLVYQNNYIRYQRRENLRTRTEGGENRMDKARDQYEMLEQEIDLLLDEAIDLGLEQDFELPGAQERFESEDFRLGSTSNSIFGGKLMESSPLDIHDPARSQLLYRNGRKFTYYDGQYYEWKGGQWEVAPESDVTSLELTKTYKDALLGDEISVYHPEEGGKAPSGNKDVYAIKDEPDKVIAILRTGKPGKAIQDEVRMLDELKEMGLPIVEIIEITTHNGRPAIVMKRYAQISKDVVKIGNGKAKVIGNSKYLNNKSIKDLREIRDSMVRNQIKIDDLQFLIDYDGSVVIADPLNVTKGSPSKNNLRMIDLLIKQAESNINE